MSSKNQQKMLEKWNRGEIEMLICHPASAGHGLNLQKGGRIAIWYGLTWSLEEYLQFNKRLHRTGQTLPVTIYRILMENTVDWAVAEALSCKKATQDDLLNYLEAQRSS